MDAESQVGFARPQLTQSKPPAIPGELSTLQVSPRGPSQRDSQGNGPQMTQDSARGSLHRAPPVARGRRSARAPCPPPGPASSPAPSPGGRPLPTPRPVLCAGAVGSASTAPIAVHPEWSGVDPLLSSSSPELGGGRGCAPLRLCERAPPSAGGGRCGTGR